MNIIIINDINGEEFSIFKKCLDIFIILTKSFFVFIFLYFNNNLNMINLNLKSVYLNDLMDNIELKTINKAQTMKIALCSVGKKENLYAKEFIEYYFNLGVNHIYIYDDNEKNDEKIRDIIPLEYYLNISLYETHSMNITHQSEAFTDCYKNNIEKFDWFIMLDMDEYLYIVNDTLEKYLNSPTIKKCDIIKINWVISRDNNLIYYEPKPLFERFRPPYIKSKFIKSIIKGNISDLEYWVHSPLYSPSKNITCNCAGKLIHYKTLNFESLTPINVEKAFIIHFRFKSTEELINKNKRGFSNWLDNKTLQWTLRGHIDDYFNQNEITLEKINYIEKELKIKLNLYRIKYYLKKLIF